MGNYFIHRACTLDKLKKICVHAKPFPNLFNSRKTTKLSVCCLSYDVFLIILDAMQPCVTFETLFKSP